MNQHEQILEDISAQDVKVHQLPDPVKPPPQKMPLSYKLQKFQNTSTKCHPNKQVMDLSSTSYTESPPPSQLPESSTTSYPPNYVPPPRVTLAMLKKIQNHRT